LIFWGLCWLSPCGPNPLFLPVVVQLNAVHIFSHLSKFNFLYHLRISERAPSKLSNPMKYFSYWSFECTSVTAVTVSLQLLCFRSLHPQSLPLFSDTVTIFINSTRAISRMRVCPKVSGLSPWSESCK
jgi:hypothetical protein